MPRNKDLITAWTQIFAAIYVNTTFAKKFMHNYEGMNNYSIARHVNSFLPYQKNTIFE